MEVQEKQLDFYQKLRKKISVWQEGNKGSHAWAEYILLAPDIFHLLVKLSFDKEVPFGEKARLAAAIAYFISPFDLIPEALLGPIGYLEDVALAVYVLNGIINRVHPLAVKKHWAGRGDILLIIKSILASTHSMLGVAVWRRLLRLFGRKL